MDSFGIVSRECLVSRKLTLYVTHPLGALGLLRLAVRAFVRGLRGAREFEAICAEEILVGMRRRQVRVAMDGEVRVLETPLRYRIQRGALRVLVPAVQLKPDNQSGIRVRPDTTYPPDTTTERDAAAAR